MIETQKERSGLPRRYTFKLAPTPAQEEAIRAQCRMIAWLWNALLQRNEDCYRRTKGQKGVTHGQGKSMLTHFDMCKEITTLRRECPEWRQLSSWTGNRVAFALEQAFKGFFRRAKQGAGASSGYPRYRSARRANWIPHIFYSGIKLRPSSGTSDKKWLLELPGIPGRVCARGKFPRQPLKWTNSDIRELQGSWWLSVCVEIEPRRESGEARGQIRFDLIDTFAHVDGNLPMPPSWGDVHTLQERTDELKAERDTRYPWKRGTKPSRKWRKMSDRISKLSARAARIRRERLHEWTTTVQRHAGDLTIIAPPVKDTTKSAKGDERNWGAAVGPIAAINRHVLSQAPASAVAMLEYKAKEAGIRCDVITDVAPATSLGVALADAGRKIRRASRKIKRGDRYEDRNRQHSPDDQQGDVAA